MRNLVRLPVRTLRWLSSESALPVDSHRIELSRQPALPEGIEELLFRIGASRLKPQMVQ